MRLSSQSFRDGGPIPARCAFGAVDADTHVRLSDNRSPHLAWSDLPAGTRSLAISCVDVDVPSRADDVNQEGREVPADLPRAEFVHWLIANIPPQLQALAEGDCSDGVSARGKSRPPGPEHSVQGRNDYSDWFAGDEAMAGIYTGYDGPCPPWNDSIIHHYHFELHALDVTRLELATGFALQDLRNAMQTHVLASTRISGLYTLNPRLLATAWHP